MLCKNVSLYSSRRVLICINFHTYKFLYYNLTKYYIDGFILLKCTLKYTTAAMDMCIKYFAKLYSQ